MLISFVSALSLTFSPCFLPDMSQQVECATLTVPAVHGSSSSETLALHIARVPAQSRADAPLIFLPGGPGQAGSDTAAMANNMLARASQKRDLILIDYRGTGRSGALKCADTMQTPGEAQSLDPLAPEALAAITECADALSQTTNLSWYTTSAIADDLELLRQALGAEQLNLYGGSYGTRVALDYMRRHPDRVRAAVLDGVAPIGWSIGGAMGRDANTALSNVLSDCAAQPACAAAFPNTEDTLDTLLGELRAAPATVSLPHPATGVVDTRPIAAHDIALAIRGVLYSETLTRLLPMQINAAANGDYASLNAAGYSFTEDLADTISMGLMLSVLCAEDIAALPTEPALQERDSFVGDVLWRYWKNACALWPVEPVNSAFYQPVSSDIPTLLLSGTWDPVTPPSNATRAAQHLSNATQISVPGHAHIAARRGCIPNVIADFYDQKSSADLDTACVDHIAPPLFFTHALGPERVDHSGDAGGPGDAGDAAESQEALP